MSSSILLVAFVVAAIISLKVWLGSASFKGKFGELQVHGLLAKHFQPPDFYVLSDVTLPTGSGTTQIDHIVVSRAGVFVIETKAYGGWIFGSERDRTWTQTFRRKKFKFSNPLRQNFGHVKVVQELLGLNDATVFNVVVFAGDAVFKTTVPDNVTTVRSLVPFLETPRGHQLSLNEVGAIRDRIEAVRLTPGAETDRTHVDNLQARHGGVHRERDLLGGVLGGWDKVQGIVNSAARISGTFTAVKRVFGVILILGLAWLAYLLILDVPLGLQSFGKTAGVEQPAAYTASLMCAYSEDTGRCSCIDSKGIRPEIEPAECRRLADRRAH